MAKKNLFIYGAGGHAKVVLDIARLQGYEVKGFLDDIKGGEYSGLPLIKPEAFLKQETPERCEVFIGIGNTATRKEKAELMKKQGFALATLIHPASVIAKDAEIGEGTVLMAGSVVNPGAHIGRNCVVNTNASVDHDCSIGDYVHLAPGATLGGGVTVGEESWVGIGACVREYKTIGRNTIIGMGAVVVKDIPDNVIALGVPAEVQKRG
ncbi:MAG: acetyltransferase [bacterium]|nr:acetyltransferase [bacterium]